MPRELDIPEITGATVLHIRPGDVLVLLCPGPVTDDAAANLRERVRSIWPDLPVLVMDNIDVAVLRRPEQVNSDE